MSEVNEKYLKRLENMRRCQRASYDYYKSRHICTRCKKNKALPDKTCCAECAEERKKYDGIRAIERLNRYNGLKEQGLCAWCGKVPPIDGQVLCETCRDKRREYKRKNYRQKRENAERQHLDS